MSYKIATDLPKPAQQRTSTAPLLLSTTLSNISMISIVGISTIFKGEIMLCKTAFRKTTSVISLSLCWLSLCVFLHCFYYNNYYYFSRVKWLAISLGLEYRSAKASNFQTMIQHRPKVFLSSFYAFTSN